MDNNLDPINDDAKPVTEDGVRIEKFGINNEVQGVVLVMPNTLWQVIDPKPTYPITGTFEVYYEPSLNIREIVPEKTQTEIELKIYGIGFDGQNIANNKIVFKGLNVGEEYQVTPESVGINPENPSEQLMIAKIPKETITGNIYVKVYIQVLENKSNEVLLTIIPKIDSLSKTKGEHGDNITITGSGLAPSPTVKFEKTTATVTVVNQNTLTVTVPDIAAGIYPVTVTVGGEISNAVNFKVIVVVPLVIALDPSPPPGEEDTNRNYGAPGDRVNIVTSPELELSTHLADYELKFGGYSAGILSANNENRGGTIYTVIRTTVPAEIPQDLGFINTPITLFNKDTNVLSNAIDFMTGGLPTPEIQDGKIRVSGDRYTYWDSWWKTVMPGSGYSIGYLWQVYQNGIIVENYYYTNWFNNWAGNTWYPSSYRGNTGFTIRVQARTSTWWGGETRSRWSPHYPLQCYQLHPNDYPCIY